MFLVLKKQERKTGNFGLHLFSCYLPILYFIPALVFITSSLPLTLYFVCTFPSTLNSKVRLLIWDLCVFNVSTYSCKPPPQRRFAVSLRFRYVVCGSCLLRPHCTGCRTSVPWPGTEPLPTTVEAGSPHHWTTREFLHFKTYFSLGIPYFP